MTPAGGFLDAPTPIAFAHRGFAPDGTENSMAAFGRAVELGYRYLETDVRVTSDGVALAFHDGSLDRVTDRAGRIDRLSWREVRQARIGGREPIPLLVDLLAAWPDTRINIDVKAESGIEPTVAAIRSTGTLHRVCVGAFSSTRVAAVRRALGSQLCTSLGPREVIRLRLPVRPHRFSAACAQVPLTLGRRAFTDARFVRAAHSAGLQVHVWTVNERSEMIRALDLDVDGIMSDRGDVLRDVLISRGQWH